MLEFVSILMAKLDSDQLFTFHSVDPKSKGFGQVIVFVLISLRATAVNSKPVVLFYPLP